MSGIESLMKLAGPVGNAVLKSAGPYILRGALIELLKSQDMTTKTVTGWVREGTSLWDLLTPSQQSVCRDYVSKLGNVSWFTAEWVIESLSEDFPAVASLIINWDEASEWLNKQVDIWLSEITGKQGIDKSSS